jgi:hypothetical protein
MNFSNTGCFKKNFTVVFGKVLCGDYVERWIVCTPLSINVFITLATRYHLEYHCKALFKIICITSGSHIEPYLSQVKLSVSCYIITVQTLYMSSEYIYTSFQSCEALFETPCITIGSHIEP